MRICIDYRNSLALFTSNIEKPNCRKDAIYGSLNNFHLKGKRREQRVRRKWWIFGFHRSRTFSKFRFETRADRSDRFGQARFREIPRRLCIGVSRWMDPCPVIREPLSGARDRTTLGQTSAPIIVLTVQLYTYVEWSVHTACPENSSIASLKISPAVLFSSRNYACNLHSAAIKFLNGGMETGMFVVGSKRRNGWMENNKILRGKEICRGYRGNVSFIIRRIRGTTRSARFETPCVAPYTRVFSWKRESMRMHMYTVRLLLDFDA